MEDKRSAYLEANFPRSEIREWHSVGPFTEEVIAFFANPFEINLKRSGTLYAVIDATDLDGSAFYEEIRVRFRLVASREQYHPMKWGGMLEPLSGSTDGVYYFTFGSDRSLDKNICEFTMFVAEHLKDELLQASKIEQRSSNVATSYAGSWVALSKLTFREAIGDIAIKVAVLAGILAGIVFSYPEFAYLMWVKVVVIALMSLGVVRDILRSPSEIVDKFLRSAVGSFLVTRFGSILVGSKRISRD